MFWFVLAMCLGVPLVGYMTRRSDAQRQLQPLRAAGWEPDHPVLGRARAALARQQIFMTTGAGLGALLTLFALEAAAEPSTYGLLGFGFVTGAILGNVAGHLSGGRIVPGRRVAEAAPRRLGHYLGRAHLVALAIWAVVSAVCVPWSLQRAGSVPGGAAWVVPAALLVGASWLLMVAVMAVAVLRRPTSARADGDLVWQEWLRARVLSDLAGSLWLSVCCVGTALWVALLEGSGAAIAMELAGWITALAVLGLFAFWWARTGIPAAVQEAVAC